MAILRLVRIAWPPRSGKVQEFPEVNLAAWFDLETTRLKVHKNQVAFIERLQTTLDPLASNCKKLW